MFIGEIIAMYEQEIKDVHAKYQTYYEDYRKEIVNKTIPLAYRWDVFKKAPSSWKEIKSYIVHFECEKLLENKDLRWYDDFCIEKYQIVDMVDIIEDMMVEDEISPEFLEAFIEEVLEKNLESFVYDW